MKTIFITAQPFTIVTLITEYVQDDQAIRIGGYPTLGATKPPAELTDDSFVEIKGNANATVKGDTGVESIEDTNYLSGYLQNAANHYAGYLIRLQWQDRGGLIPQILEEYKRLIGVINEATEAQIPGKEETTIGFHFTSSYKSHGLNPEVEPYFSTTE
jgi:hypothetical protein